MAGETIRVILLADLLWV